MEFYGLDYADKSFAIANPFVVNTNKACYTLGTRLVPFCMYATEKQKEAGLLDFSTFAGFVDATVPLVDEIAKQRQESYAREGITLDITNPDTKKLLVYDYLMSISLCYVEVPKWVTKYGKAEPSYDKFLVTRNPQIMATWMGSTSAEMQAKYSPRINHTQINLFNNELKFVKLNHTAKGNTISVPRKAYTITKMTCIPFYMLYAFLEGAKTVYSDKIVEFTYLKDNGTERVLATTLNQDILRQFYEPNFVAQMLSGVDINTLKLGGMLVSSSFHRGYIKVPEVGASIYDGTGCRSLNFARLLKARVLNVSDIDRTYINVDLSSVLENFSDAVDYLVKTNKDAIGQVYKLVTDEDMPNPDTEPLPVIIAHLKEYTQTRATLLSTTYLRSLHKLMISNPLLFPLYTGLPNSHVVSSASFGVSTMDF